MSNQIQVISGDKVVDLDIESTTKLSLSSGELVDLSQLDIDSVKIINDQVIQVTLANGEKLTLTLSDAEAGTNFDTGIAAGFGLILPSDLQLSNVARFKVTDTSINSFNIEATVYESSPPLVLYKNTTEGPQIVGSNQQETIGYIEEEAIEAESITFADLVPRENSQLVLTANATITEQSTSITYTATLSAAADGNVQVTLSNGDAITILDGVTTGSVTTPVVADEDAHLDANTISANILAVSGTSAAFITIDTSVANTLIEDTIDVTTLTLSATQSVTEAETAITYTATLSNAADTDVTITLSNGDTISIIAGNTTGSVISSVVADEDALIDATSISTQINMASGGNFESLVIDNTAAVTVVNDTIDVTTVSLTSTASITEADTEITYTATLSNVAAADVIITLSNGDSITIASGSASGSVISAITADEDVQLDATSISANIASASGGGFESLVIDNTSAVTAVTDTIDTTTVSLSATPSITEAASSVTYTASLTSATQGDITVTLSNGDTIVIADGATSGSVVSAVTPNEDIYQDATSINASISAATGGNFESLVVDSSLAVTAITDTIDSTTVSLSATPSITEADTAITYTATLSAVTSGDVVVNLSNGDSITIADGNSIGTVTTAVTADEDVYLDATSISASISSASGGNFEQLDINASSAVTAVSDTINGSTVSLTATPAISEADTVVTYTAALTSAAQGAVTVSLSNGDSITIADGATVRTAATALGIEVGTAYNHLQSIGKKLGTRSVTHSLVAALRSELITLHPST